MRQLFVVPVLALAVALAGCGGAAGKAQAPGAAQPPAAAKPSSAAPRTTGAPLPEVKVAPVYVADMMLPLWMAVQQGYFRHQGLNVQVVNLTGSSAGIAALLSGEVQFIFSAPGPATIEAAVRNPNIVMLGATERLSGFHLVANVARLQDLKGKTVGISRFGGLDQLQTIQALKQAGMSGGDVHFVPVGSQPQLMAALVAHKIAAAPIAEPFAYEAVRRGEHDLFNLNDLPTPFAGTAPYTLRSYVTKNPPVAEGMLRALIQANYEILADPSLSEQLLQQHLHLKASLAKVTYTQSTAPARNLALSPSMAALKAVIQESETVVPRLGSVKPASLLDLAPLQAVQASGFVRQVCARLAAVKSNPAATNVWKAQCGGSSAG